MKMKIFQLKGPVNIFNKIIEGNFPNLKKEMPMKKITEFQIDWTRKEITPDT
jgi:DNA polymerase III sliding clamp (beta) subunit (PCNA family)